MNLLLDSSVIGYQAHYSLGKLSHGDIATGVVFGFLSRVLHLGQTFRTNQLVFCWDSSHSFRSRRFPWYKAKRRVHPPEEQESIHILYRQLALLRRTILPQIGFVNQILQEGCEADDVLAKIAQDPEGEWIIVTSDEDMFQCLAPNVRIYNANKKQMMTLQRLMSDYQVTPQQWLEAKSIAGCSSDNVPGVPGIGMKTAIKYLLGKLKPTTQSYQAITAAMTEGLIMNVNLPLVQIPLSRTEKPKLAPNEFNVDNFTEVCELYGLESFLKPEKMAEWISLFQGHLTGPIPAGYNTRRPPRRHRAENKSNTDREPGLLYGL